MTVTQFTTPTGRLVWGDPTQVHQKKYIATGALRTKKDGSPLMTCEIGVAFAKNDAAAQAFIAQLRSADAAEYPQFHGPDGNPLPGVKFADKIVDGDGHDSKGKPLAERDGYAGHWIISFSRATGDTPPLKRHDGTRWVDMEPTGLDCGDYIIVGGSTSANGSATSPGMYRNIDMVGFVGKGQRIVRGRDADESLGAAPALPAGATATPQAPAAEPLPSSPPPTTQASAPPYDAHLPPPPAAAGPQMTDKANGATYDAFIAKGWTDEMLREQGYLV